MASVIQPLAHVHAHGGENVPWSPHTGAKHKPCVASCTVLLQGECMAASTCSPMTGQHQSNYAGLPLWARTENSGAGGGGGWGGGGLGGGGLGGRLAGAAGATATLRMLP